MNDFRKNVLMMILTAVFGAGVSSFATVTSVSVEISHLTKTNQRMLDKLDKHDDRIRANEIKLAGNQYIVSNKIR